MKHGLHSVQLITQRFAGVTAKEARRLVTTGQVKIHGLRVKDPAMFCEIKNNTTVEVGLLQFTVVY
jgi:ribosomal protein S4